MVVRVIGEALFFTHFDSSAHQSGVTTGFQTGSRFLHTGFQQQTLLRTLVVDAVVAQWTFIINGFNRLEDIPECQHVITIDECRYFIVGSVTQCDPFNVCFTHESVGIAASIFLVPLHGVQVTGAQIFFCVSNKHVKTAVSTVISQINCLAIWHDVGNFDRHTAHCVVLLNAGRYFASIVDRDFYFYRIAIPVRINIQQGVTGVVHLDFIVVGIDFTSRLGTQTIIWLVLFGSQMRVPGGNHRSTVVVTTVHMRHVDQFGRQSGQLTGC